MVKRWSQVLVACFLISDLAMTGLAWISAYYIRFSSGWVPFRNPGSHHQVFWSNLPLVLLLAPLAYHLNGQYAIHRLRRLREEAVCLFKGATLLSLMVLAMLFLRHDMSESRPTIVIFYALAVFYLVTARRFSWAIIRTLRSHGYNQSYAIIVGSGRVARKTARALRSASWMGIKSLGFVDEHASKLSSDLDVMGSFADLPELIRKYGVGNVFIALPMSRYDDARRVFAILSQSLVEVRLVMDVPNLAGLSLTTSNLDGMPLIGLRESPHFGLNIVVKRAMDVALSFVGLIVLSPLMALLAVLVKLTSPGPIFYRQPRCGLNGRTFDMLKFRSLYVDAEKHTGAVWAKKDDPRRTPLGKFIRKTSLDELPQLWNVLWGDMSLVGPRPERPELIQKFSQTIPNYMVRHCVKAGITGWAQVHGWRGNTSLRKRLQYDLYYITHWNPWLDLRILWMTVRHGIIHKNAY